MDVADGRVIHRKKVKAANKAKVKKYFDKNRGSTISDCALSTGLHRATVGRIVKEIQGEEGEE